MPEHPLDADVLRSRSIDVLLTRVPRREAVVVEIWDWFNDVGAAMRGLDGKMAAIRRSLGQDGEGDTFWRVGGLWVIRGTQRNRQLVRELEDLFAAKFRGNPRGWLSALTGPGAAMPAEPGFLWTDVGGTRLMEVRLGRIGPHTP